jgi:hypothetical protein
MADGQGETPPPDAQALARDWITIWQSELAASATDRELQEGWVRLINLWAQAAASAARMLPGTAPREPARGSAGPTAQAGSPPTMAASDDRDATIRRLADRVADLERRLAAIGPGGPGHGDSGA